MLDQISGLPAHPLIVHLPIVLGPVLGLLTLGMLMPAWRERLVRPVAALAVIFFLSALLATESGEKFAETLQVGDAIEAHEEAAEMLRNLGLLLAIVAVAFAVRFRKFSTTLQTAGVVLIALIGVGVIGFTVKTGHEGAKQVWQAEYDAARAAQGK